MNRHFVFRRPTPSFEVPDNAYDSEDNLGRHETELEEEKELESETEENLNESKSEEEGSEEDPEEDDDSQNDEQSSDTDDDREELPTSSKKRKTVPNQKKVTSNSKAENFTWNSISDFTSPPASCIEEEVSIDACSC